MKLFNLILNLTLLVGCLFSSFIKAEQYESTTRIIGDVLYLPQLSSNKSNECVFKRSISNNFNDASICYFNADEDKEINVTDCVGEHLLNLGYQPTSFSTTGKPWDGKYTLDYKINLAYKIDDYGNVLVLFTYEDRFYINNGKHWLYNLGVWNRKHGFKVINTEGLDQLHGVLASKGDYLYVIGKTLNGRDETQILVISIKDGYWGERVHPKPEEPTKEEPASEKSWWDKVKSSWLKFNS